MKGGKKLGGGIEGWSRVGRSKGCAGMKLRGAGIMPERNRRDLGEEMERRREVGCGRERERK